MARANEPDDVGADGPEVVVAAAMSRGDTDHALRLLMDAYGQELHRFASQQVGNEADATDLVQLTFVHAYEGLSKFEGRSTYRTWLYGIARHRCLDHHRKRRRRARRFEEYTTQHDSERDDVAPPVDDELGDRELVVLLEECLQELAPHVRMAVLLRYQQGLSFAEMASLGRERPKALETRVRRALQQLRKCVKDKGGER